MHTGRILRSILFRLDFAGGRHIDRPHLLFFCHARVFIYVFTFGHFVTLCAIFFILSCRTRYLCILYVAAEVCIPCETIVRVS